MSNYFDHLLLVLLGVMHFLEFRFPSPLEKLTGCGLVSLPLVEVGAVPVELFIII